VTQYREASDINVYDWAIKIAMQCLNDDIGQMKATMDAILKEFYNRGCTPKNALSFWNELSGFMRTLDALSVSRKTLPYMTLFAMIEKYSTVGDMFAELYENLSAVRVKPIDANVANPLFFSLLLDIGGDFSQSAGLNGLAKKYGLGVGLCRELFRKVTGKTYKEYLIAARLEYAYKRIISGEKDIQALSVQCGYNDYYYFTRSFKKYYGTSPLKLSPHKIC
jgi:AraC-like DNA-binding protein